MGGKQEIGKGKKEKIEQQALESKKRKVDLLEEVDLSLGGARLFPSMWQGT